MSIRLNKALRELNVGLQTAVEFLEKRKELGEVKSEPSFKLNDAQYAALLEAFKQDADVRNKAELLTQKKTHVKKQASSEKAKSADELLKRQTQKFTMVGKIDLDNLGKKPKATASAAPASEKPEAKTAAVSQAGKENRSCQS